MNTLKNAVLVKEVIYPIVIIFVGIFVYLILSKSVKRIFKLRIGKVDIRRSKTLCSVINNILKYIILIFCVLAVLEVYNISTKGIVTSLGVVGLVAGLAFQDTLKDLLAGFSIIFENAYAVGDTVTINEFKGKVISLGLKTTKIKSINGDIKIISNSNITEIINHSLDDTYDFIDIPVDYKEDVSRIEEILSNLCDRILKEVKNVLDIELLGVNELDSSSVNFRIKVKTKPELHYDVRRKILKLVKMEFDEKKITIPFNQVVVHNARV